MSNHWVNSSLSALSFRLVVRMHRSLQATTNSLEDNVGTPTAAIKSSLSRSLSSRSVVRVTLGAALVSRRPSKYAHVYNSYTKEGSKCKIMEE